MAIVGYGPVGATAANLLGQLGLKVVVIERDPDIYNRARAISTDEEVMRVWQSVGLADRLQQDMLGNRPLAFVDATGAPFYETTITGRGCGHPPQQFIYQPAVDEVLRTGVARFAGVQVLLEHECLRVANKDDHVELMLADLRRDAFKRIRATYVIAADGGSSPTRGQLGVGYSGKTYSERWVVIDTEVIKKWDAHDRLRFHCNPARPTVDCPTPLGHHRWEYPARGGADDKQLTSDEAVWRVLNEQGITEEHVKILRAVIYRHHVRVADRWRVGRIFLAGDAAHAMPPWIGQGMAAGVRDVANLCWKLAAVLRGQASDSLLDSYETERKPHVTEVTRRAVLIGRIITERNPVLATIRNHLLRILTKSAAISRQGQKLYWIPEAHYADGFFAGAGHRAEGRQIIQPWVIDDAGMKCRLDDVLQRRWTLLHVGAVPTGAQAWLQRGVTAIPVRDTTLTAWFHRHRASAAILRPDGFVYTAAGSGTALASPPPRLNCAPPAAVATAAPIRREVPA
ncbi:3-(3-hydroxy-phenyl)propionate/3-hydroxycinnamic acid hydroxylase [Mycobacterium kiyosense]|uniref:3-(3-hydroxy-phenyl)propionate/3-hydroxycinnamic acid hydroxylase n=1 Tax=Mycobacterium kiyosense TaxID=2871094 RepID=A0A9P3UZT7_9MYCO|nr:3-(3-hydroxy-phenyl)propionate/3-hydroxycinnamic acid hydroxylase [Mycobacterium kiyosense]BDE11637.1 3-(3-hydroxy-phenyl)propionate/3-hydroxycinnamic acid hydroxylase [Mycobacterium sp. 20KCMC460]GLB81915.1 3-(3-hydroxy-phenyl)propionate/3-hydroxycinnamic acid hydroxylase [Mycobacterium kiyosense]GLB88125.1 3-(3-hydroxy-phenyl)propionate/3-hydroxycinnamic acid hydroxylase [Mycobacterium kiyosense]GLB95685.1 3-(3-hydroxy-phenyl)propionate/3-hydroxycinnamic acid hydroxylase [Mycobacterium kiy